MQRQLLRLGLSEHQQACAHVVTATLEKADMHHTDVCNDSLSIQTAQSAIIAYILLQIFRAQQQLLQGVGITYSYY